MSTNTTTAPTPTKAAKNKLFSSFQLAYAIKQALDAGFRVVEQPMNSISNEGRVTVKEFKPATTKELNYQQKEILGYMTLTQKRTILFDPRTQAERMAGEGSESIRSYTRELQCTYQVVTKQIAEMTPGQALPADFYIAEVVTFQGVYPTHRGIVTSTGKVRRFSSKFLCSIDSRNPERQSDVMLLSPLQFAAYEEGRATGQARQALAKFIDSEQRASGILTDEDIAKAIAYSAANRGAQADDAGDDHDTTNTPNATMPTDDAANLPAAGDVSATGFGGAATSQQTL